MERTTELTVGSVALSVTTETSQGYCDKKNALIPETVRWIKSEMKTINVCQTVTKIHHYVGACLR